VRLVAKPTRDDIVKEQRQEATATKRSRTSTKDYDDDDADSTGAKNEGKQSVVLIELISNWRRLLFTPPVCVCDFQ